MALRVEASRFAVLKVEDDDDSDKNDDKPKNMPNKGNQRQTEAKKKPKKKKRTEEIRADSEVFSLLSFNPRLCSKQRPRSQGN